MALKKQFFKFGNGKNDIKPTQIVYVTEDDI